MDNKDNRLNEKLGKTTLLIGVTNLVLSPLFLLDSKMGLIISVTANALLLHQLHELGKRRRPGSNTLNRIHTFFSSQVNGESLEVDNALKNVINGGEAVYNEISTSLK